jgi:hypothetical protein
MAHRVTRTLPIPHGIVFIYDPTAIVTVADDTGTGRVLATDDCLSLWTVHDADGSTTLTLTDEEESALGEVVFEGSLSAPGKTLAFNTSRCDAIISVGLNSVRPHLVVYADDAAEPSRLVCRVVSQAR